MTRTVQTLKSSKGAQRLLFLAFSVVCWCMFLGVFLYACGFVGNFLVPKTIDGAPTDPLWKALLINSALIGIFGIQHSVMARPGFKRVWTRVIPEPIERSVYVLISNLLMILLFWQWRPMGGVIWNVENEVGRIALYTLFGIGWAIVPAATLMTNHFDLFGLRQAWLHFRGREYTPIRFGPRGFYRYVRHPLYVGWLLAFWATPTMTAAHLLFAVLTTAYIIAAIPLEERDLIAHLGGAYRDYRRRVPALVPGLRRGTDPSGQRVEPQLVKS